MKFIKTASGKKQIKISKSEWGSIGKTAGWGDYEGDRGLDTSELEAIENTKNLMEKTIKQLDHMVLNNQKDFLIDTMRNFNAQFKEIYDYNFSS